MKGDSKADKRNDELNCTHLFYKGNIEMEDRVTEIILEMDYSKLVEIVQAWATEVDFSIHEKTAKRILYADKHGYSGTKWLSIENFGSNTKISAWAAPKGLGPDQKGNFWKGNKLPIPTGFAMGPLGRFKEQFNSLLERIKHVSDDAPFNLNTENANPPVVSKENFAKGLLFLAIIIILEGALNVYNGSSSMLNQIFPSFAKSSLQSGIMDVVIGIVLFFSSRLMKNGKVFSIWLFGIYLLFSIGYDLAIGANFPFFPILFGVWAFSQLLGLKKQGQLT